LSAFHSYKRVKDGIAINDNDLMHIWSFMYKTPEGVMESFLNCETKIKEHVTQVSKEVEKTLSKELNLLFFG
jgi:hypothetical protein